MFIRRTKTRHTASGESYYSHRLVRSERTASRVRQRTLLNLGRHFEFDQTHWPAFCAYLEDLLKGQEVLIPPELAADAGPEAQRIVARIIAREAPPSSAAPAAPARDYQSIDVDSMALVRPRSVGVEQLGLWAMEQTGMIQHLELLGWTESQRVVAMGLIIGRMAAPGSELATYRWLSESSALGELLDVDFATKSLMQLYRCSDRLMAHREAIEGQLFNRVAEVFGLSCTVTLYDLSNTYFEGAAASNPKAKRGRDRHFDVEQAITIRSAGDETVHLQKQLSEDGQEARLHCLSEQRAKKERGISQRFSERFEPALKKMSEGLSRPRTTRKVDKLWERIGHLKEKSHGIGQHYQVDVIADESGEKATEIRWQRKPVEGSQLTAPGVYCLRSNVTDWDEERMWRTTMMLTDLESVFRSLKSELGLRPIYHHKEIRSDGHLFITVLAYQLMQFIRRRLIDRGRHDSWTRIRNIMNNQHRITATFRRKDGRSMHIRKATRAESEQKAIYDSRGINPSPGGVSKMIV